MTDDRTVFVVHGRNTPVRNSMFEFLRAINLKPLEWDNAVELTGKASPYIGEVLDAAFDHARAVVVLMTPDEVAYLDKQWAHGDDDTEADPAPQARPNVLFEAGMALGRNPDRTLLVEVGTVRPFSDIGGRHAIRLTNNPESRQSFATRLRNTGLAVETTGTDWMTTGDFTATPPGGGLTLGRRVLTQPTTTQPIAFDATFHRTAGSNTFDKLRITNRGSETAYDVTVTIPDDAALQLTDKATVEKIPGHGKAVTLHVWNENNTFGGDHRDTFDITVTGHTEDGTEITDELFIDING